MGYAFGPLDTRAVGIGTQLGSVVGNTLVLWLKTSAGCLRQNLCIPVAITAPSYRFNAEATGRDY